MTVLGYSIDQIGAALSLTVVGDGSLIVNRVAEPSEATPDALALAMSKEYASGLCQGAALAAILWEGADWQNMGLKAALLAKRPRHALSGLTKMLDAGPKIPLGVHSSAQIDPTANIGNGACIGPFVVIGSRVTIGLDARIAAHVVVEEEARIGCEAILLAGAKIGARVQIGDRFLAQQGAVIGADGFSFVTPEKSAVESTRETLSGHTDIGTQSWHRIHSLGAVVIGDDVEVGANSTIDRGTVHETKIGDGTKIDNQVQIGHNVKIGCDCLLCGHSGVAGSTVLGDRVVVGGAASIADHLTVGDDVVIAGKSGIASNVPSGRAMMGYPAMPMDRSIEAYKALRRLPRLFDQVANLRSSLRGRKDG